MMKKSQYSMEFMIFFAIMFILFSVWLVVYANLNQDAYERRDTKAIVDVGKAIRSNLFAASKARTGYHSNNLIIPSKAGSADYDVFMQNENGSYVFYLRSDGQDYVFNIPFTIGKLAKGQNTLWNVCGVVAINEHPPISDENCKVRFAECSDFLDNDGDGLIDEEDGGCWTDYDGPPYYEWEKDSEYVDDPPPSPPPPFVPGVDDVFNYYILCRNAEATGTCGLLGGFSFPNGFTLTEDHCKDNTNENYCGP